MKCSGQVEDSSFPDNTRLGGYFSHYVVFNRSSQLERERIYDDSDFPNSYRNGDFKEKVTGRDVSFQFPEWLVSLVSSQESARNSSFLGILVLIGE
ncbi:hypothetical protein AVEN_233174-1 [Araneus ventricosus]|uniref:Uncharacterized protein n=1 Tax=Araneus ventricosus TaxID=182803 RepID=A0A4Y2EJL0_ARAVE|nr:hypothetical protein AVEN_233174-1 [Araneus ventricosus]